MENAKDIEKIEEFGIDDGEKIILMEMINDDPETRPDLNELMDAFEI